MLLSEGDPNNLQHFQYYPQIILRAIALMFTKTMKYFMFEHLNLAQVTYFACKLALNQHYLKYCKFLYL